MSMLTSLFCNKSLLYTTNKGKSRPVFLSNYSCLHFFLNSRHCCGYNTKIAEISISRFVSRINVSALKAIKNAFWEHTHRAECRDTSGILNTTQREIRKAATTQKNRHTKKMVVNSETGQTFHSITKTQTIVAVRFTLAF